MINAVGRDIPEEILEKTGKEVFQGVHHFDGHVYKKHGPEVEDRKSTRLNSSHCG